MATPSASVFVFLGMWTSLTDLHGGRATATYDEKQQQSKRAPHKLRQGVNKNGLGQNLLPPLFRPQRGPHMLARLTCISLVLTNGLAQPHLQGLCAGGGSGEPASLCGRGCFARLQTSLASPAHNAQQRSRHSRTSHLNFIPYSHPQFRSHRLPLSRPCGESTAG